MSVIKLSDRISVGTGRESENCEEKEDCDYQGISQEKATGLAAVAFQPAANYRYAIGCGSHLATLNWRSCVASKECDATDDTVH
jgi:hypothetical protein